MKIMKTIIINLSIAICFSFFHCNEEKDIVMTTDTVQSDLFAFEFFRTVAAKETKDNYTVSPISLSLALSMLYNGALEETKIAFEQTLNYVGVQPQEVNNFNRNLIQQLSSNEEGKIMEIANSIWIHQNLPVQENFITVNKTYYDSEVRNEDFRASSTLNKINTWVSEKTHEKIPKILDNIPEDAILYLINTLYFNASWKYTFDPEVTRTMSFYKNNSDTISVEMMQLTHPLPYARNDIFSSVILPYKDDKFSMLIFLPEESKTIEEMVEALMMENWKKWLDGYETLKVNVHIPKFKLAYENKLNDELKSMGLGVAFSPSANFRNMTPQRCKISRVIQKTFIDVNEEGTEAAAATVIGIVGFSIPDFAIFYVNRPFIYLIKENRTNAICFIGKVGHPTYEE